MPILCWITLPSSRFTYKMYVHPIPSKTIGNDFSYIEEQNNKYALEDNGAWKYSL